MFAMFRQFGDMLDRIDLAGWTLTLCGMAVIAATVLTPAYLEMRNLQAQRDLLLQAAQRTEGHRDNYLAFNEALQGNDPLLLKRLAWHHLRMRPEGTLPVRVIEDRWQVPSIDHWVAPPPELGEPPPTFELPDSALVRLITGEPRPWVLAFGAWLILVGLLINPIVPGREADEADDAECDDEDDG